MNKAKKVLTVTGVIILCAMPGGIPIAISLKLLHKLKTAKTKDKEDNEAA